MIRHRVMLGLSFMVLVTVIPAEATGRYFGLFVGIDHYAAGYASSLPSCVNDAKGMRAYLSADNNRWSISRMTLYTDQTATKRAIRTHLTDLASETTAGDTVLYYQSSHGGQVSGTDSFLFTYDQNYYDWELAQDLAAFSSGVTIIIIIDACHSGGMFMQGQSATGGREWNFAANTMARMAHVEQAEGGLSKGESIGWITSSRYDELSWAYFPYSVFTGYAIEGLVEGDANLDGSVSFMEVFDYAAPRASADTRPSQTAKVFNQTVLSTTIARSVASDVISIADAVDAMNLSWTTGGSADWFGQAATTYDGEDAARSGYIRHDQQSWMQTTVTGPGTIRFWWKVSSEAGYDWLDFFIGNDLQDAISGAVDWEHRSFDVPAGTHTLKWQYAKDYSVTHGADSGWVDQIAWFPASAMYPSGGEVISDRRPAFTWTAIHGATWYQLILHRNGVAYQKDWVNTTTWIPDGDLPGGDYQWWVRAWGQPLGNMWSSEAMFSIPADVPGIPTPTGPLGTQALGERRPVFGWDVDGGAAEWMQILLWRDGSVYLSQWFTAGAMWMPSADLPAGHYEWWVRGWNSDGLGDWSDLAAAFEIPAMHPDPIVQIGPEGQQEGHNLDFRWEKDARATWYQLWVSRPLGGAWHNQWYGMSGSGEAVVPLDHHPGGASSWSVRGWGPDGMGEWSTMDFDTAGPEPAKPTLIAPVGETGSPVMLAYESARAEWFRVVVMLGGTVVHDDWTRDTTVDLGAVPAGSYAWWVLAANDAARAWSDRGDFEVDILR